MDWTNIQMVLVWLTGIGAPAVVMVLLSLAAENWKAWATFPTAVKYVLPMILSVFLSVGSSILLKYPDIVSQIAPWFQIIMVSILAWIASQRQYQKSLNARYGKRFIGIRGNYKQIAALGEKETIGG